MDCEAVCPAGAINIITHPEFTDQQVANDRDLQKQHGYKYNNFYKFYIDFSKCVHCQACVKICESKALSVQEGEVLPVLEKKKLKRDLLSSK